MKQLFFILSMKIKLILTFFALAAILHPVAAQCPSQYYVQSPELFSGCLHLTTDPVFQNCPQMISLPPIHPNYCGYMGPGNWKNYTHPCELYHEGAIGYYHGPCICARIFCPASQDCIDGGCFAEKTCDDIYCGDGYQCIDAQCHQIITPPPEPQCETHSDCLLGEECVEGKCQEISCIDKCPEYETCEYGVCYRKFDFFCSRIQPQIERAYCPIQRPTNADCMTTYFLPPYTPTVCGIGYDKSRTDFPAGCQACKFSYIQYYFHQACSTVPENIQCGEGQVCVDGQCQCPDFCADVVCPPGRYCDNGVCLKTLGYCQSDYDCTDGKFCGQYNICEPRIIVDPCSGVYCSPDEKCQGGKCYDLCYEVYCPDKTECRHGYCYTVDPICLSNSDCEPYEICDQAKCVVNPCYGVQCSPDEYCDNGFCHPKYIDPCKNVYCPPDQKCVGGACAYIDPYPYPDPDPSLGNGRCSTNKDCPATKVCIGSFCKVMQCQKGWQCAGSPCVNGLCWNDAYP